MSNLKLRHAIPLVPLLIAGCLPGTGHIELFGDASLAPGTDVVVMDGGSIQPDAQGASQQDGSIPNLDLLAQDGVGLVPEPQQQGAPDSGLSPQPDTGPQAPQAPQGPQPPFGSSVGMTAANFTNIPDCSSTMYSLHSYFNQKKGVLIAMMSPS